ncbi:MAG: DUF1905 domain-containing protein [Candidatus Doudnabacteria bacterium]|nr:DUF1905 domain-containing protein [Candidatus Doudnabacteria bacterium]
MHVAEFTFKAKPWVYPGQAAWHFVSVPKKESARIKALFGGLQRGFGSFPVTVSIGKTTWLTSIFPDPKTGTYLLPVKAAVRKKEGVVEGKAVSVTLAMRV